MAAMILSPKTMFLEMLKVQESLFRNLFDSMHSNVNSRIDGVIKDLTELKSSLQFLQNDIDDRKELLSKLKQAVFKADDPTVLTNYRPISILPAFSKLFERVM